MLKSRMKMFMMLSLLAALFLVLGACSTNEANTESTGSTGSTESTESIDGNDQSNIDMPVSGEVPQDLKVAEGPTYEVGSKAFIKANHMEGMEGAKATIVGAYDTTVYMISYTPKSSKERVENYKWVTHEELQDAGDAPLEPGAEVIINATHMEGMEGTTAKIDSAEETTVYMVDFTPMNGGEEVKNHKWVIESELLPVK